MIARCSMKLACWTERDRLITGRYQIVAPVLHQHANCGAPSVLSRAIPIIA